MRLKRGLASEHLLFDRSVFGIGVKLKDLRLSLASKLEDEEKSSGNEILGGRQKLLADEWEVVPAPKKPDDKKPRTRLSAKKKDKISVSVGYLSRHRRAFQGSAMLFSRSG